LDGTRIDLVDKGISRKAVAVVVKGGTIPSEIMIINRIPMLSRISIDYEEVKQGFHDYSCKIKQVPC
jgi:hypothetical protein